MAQTIKLKRSSVAGNIPGTSDLALGEIAINTADGAVYIKKGNDDIVAVHDNDILHIDTTNSRVGIGTTSPAQALHIKQTGSPTLRIEDGDGTEQYIHIGQSNGDTSFVARNNTSVGTYSFYQFDGSTLSERLKIQSDGDVTINQQLGVGTTSPQNNLHVNAGSGGGVTLEANANVDIDFRYRSGGVNKYNVAYDASEGSLIWYDNTASAHRMTLSSAGNLGIGTTSPSEKLSISAGNIALDDNRYITWGSNTGRVKIAGNESLDDIRFNTDNSERMRLTNTGLGIGTTSPSQKLDVAGHININTPSGASQSGYALKLNKTNSSSQVQLGAELLASPWASNTNGGNLIIKTANSSGTATNAMTIDGGQNVGIGTTSPAAKLHIGPDVLLNTYTTDRTTLAVSDITDGAELILRGQSPRIWFDATSGGNGQMYMDSAELQIYSGRPGSVGTQRLNINSSGAVTFNNAYTFPTSDGTSNQVLVTDGAGNLSFGDVSGSSGISVTNNANNRVLTGDGTNANAEANLTFDGSILTLTGGLNASGNIDLADNGLLRLGTGDDLQIKHTGSESQIFNSTGQLDIRSSTRILLTSSAGENMARFTNNGAVELYYDNSKKLSTESDGIRVEATAAHGGIKGYGSTPGVYLHDTDSTTGWHMSVNGNLYFLYDSNGDEVYNSIAGYFDTNLNWNIQSGSLRMNGVTVIDSSRNLSNIGTISSGAITSSGRIKTTNGLFQADEDSQKFRQYHIETLDAGGSFLLGQIENNSSTDGGVEGVVRFAYDFGSTTNNCAIHFNFAQRSGTARGTWWYEHDDQDGAADRVHVRLIDDTVGNMYVWVTCVDYAETFIEANWRHGANVADSGTLSSGTLTTGTTLFDTADDPTSEMHIGKLFAHDNVYIPDSNYLLIGDGEDLQLQHNGSHSYIRSNTGDLYIRNNANDKDIIFQSEDGSGGVTTYFTVDGSARDVVFNKDIKLNDTVQVQVGSSADLQILHDASDSFLINNTGDLYIRNNTDDKDIILQSDDGSGGLASYFSLDGSNARNRFHRNVFFGDGIRADFGDSSDLQIYHDGSNSYIRDLGTGNLRIDSTDFYVRNSAGTELKIAAVDDGAVTLYYDGSYKLVTKSDGVDIIGELQADSLDIDGNADITGTVGIGNKLTITSNVDEVLSLNNTDDGPIYMSFERSLDRHAYLGFGGSSDAFNIMNEESGGSLTFGTAGSTRLTITNAGHAYFEQNVIIAGDLTVNGTTTTLNTATLDVEDKNITLNYGSGDTSATANGAGITIQDAVDASTDATILWDTGNDRFNYSHGISLPDTKKLQLGSGSDFEIYHDGGNSYIADVGTGNLFIRGENNVVIENNSGSNYFEGTSGGATRLYFAGNERLTTTSDGTNFTGNVTVNVDSSSSSFGNHQAALRIDNTNTTTNNWAALVFDSNNGSSAEVSARFTDHTNNYADLYFANRGSGGYTTKMFISQDGNVGIGTTSPSSKLVVSDSGGAGLEFIPQTSNDRTTLLSYDRNTSTYQTVDFDGSDIHFNIAGNEKARIDSSGNLGIGTTTPDEFGIGGAFKYLAVGGDKPGILNLIDDGTNGSYLQFGNAAGLRRASIHAENGSDLSFTLNSSNTGTNLTERLRIKASSGNVGIGTSSPSYKLDVNGETRIQNQLRIEASTPSIRFIDSDDNSDGYIQANAGTLRFYADDANEIGSSLMTWNIDGSEKMRLKSNGFLGIGTDTPLDLLHLKSTSTDARAMIDGHTGYDAELKFAENGTVKYTIGHDAASDSLIVGTTNVDTEQRLAVSSNGFIRINHNNGSWDGLGTLTVRQKADGQGIGIIDSDSQNTLELLNNGTSANIYYNANNPIIFSHVGGERMRITGSGNVGIGTISPSEKLHVAGNIVADNKVFDADVQVPNQNLLDISSIQMSNANDIYSNVTKTVIDDFKATFANDNTGGTTIRIYVDDGILVDGDTYTVSVYYEGLVGTLSMDWCDVALTGSHKSATGTTSSPASGRIYGYASKADYTSTFRFLDINLTQGASNTVTLFHPKVEEGTQVTDFVATERTNQEGNSKDLNNLNVTGKVGVGTSSPAYPLDVQFSGDSGTRIKSTANHASLYLDGHTGYGGYIRFSQANTNKYWINVDTSGKMLFRPAATGTEDNIVSFSTAGKIGVGENSPVHKVEAKGTDAALIAHYHGQSRGGVAALSGQRVAFLSTSTNDDLVFGKASNPVASSGFTEYMRIDNGTGRVGIGTTSPSQPLTVTGADSIGIDDYVLHNGDGDTKFGFNGADSFKVRTGGGDRFVIGNDNSYFNNNVGIGTTSPSQKLTVEGNIELGTGGYIYGDTTTTSLRLSNSAGSQLSYGTGILSVAPSFTYSGGGSERFRVTDQGLVGIGTGSPDGDLEVVASTTVSGASDSVNNVLIGLQSTNRPTIILDTADTTYTNRTWNITNVGSAGTLRIGRNGLDVMSLKNDGKVGIGTDSPGEKLEVSGGHIKITNTGNTNLYINANNAGSDATIYFEEQDSVKAMIQHDASNDSMLFTDGALTNTMTLKGAKVGIGAVTNPQSLLDISDGLSDTKYLRTHFPTSTNYNAASANTEERVPVGLRFGWYNQYWQIGGARSGGTDIDGFIISDTGDERLVINNAGNVGIGTTSPASKLSTAGTIRAEGMSTITGGGKGTEIRYDTSGDYGGILAYDRANSAYKELRVEGSIIKFKESGTDVMTIDGNKVGIGTTSPDYLLDVNPSSAAAYARLKGTHASLMLDRSSTSYDSNLMFMTGGTTKWRLWNDGSDNTLQIRDEVNSANVMTWEAGGQVGIGTASPSYQLDIQGSTASARVHKTANDATVVISSSTAGAWTTYKSPNFYTGALYVINGVEQWAAGLLQGVDRWTIRKGRSGSEYFTITNPGKVGISQSAPAARFQVEEYGIDTTETSSTATTQIAIHTFAATDFRSARFTVQVTNSTDSTYHTTELLLVHDGTTANITEFGEIHTGSAVEATFDADISSGNVRLLATPASTDTMAFKVVCHSITT